MKRRWFVCVCWWSYTCATAGVCQLCSLALVQRKRALQEVKGDFKTPPPPVASPSFGHGIFSQQALLMEEVNMNFLPRLQRLMVKCIVCICGPLLAVVKGLQGRTACMDAL